MKTMKLVTLGIVAGIIVSVVGGLFIYFNFFKSNYDDNLDNLHSLERKEFLLCVNDEFMNEMIFL